MTTDNWTASGQSFWTLSNFWSLGGPPFANQDAFVGTAAAGGTLTVDFAETVNSLGVGAKYTVAVTHNLTATVGTGSQSIASTGTVLINFATFQVGGNVDNAGTIELETGSSATNFEVATNANVTLYGGGNVEMDGAAGNSNFFMLSPGATLLNVNNDISGTGTISGGTFQNQGTIETNNGFGAGTLDIFVNTPTGDSFDNQRHGLMKVDAGGTMVLGLPVSSSQITNSGTLQLLASSSQNATLQIAGNLTINNANGIIGLDGGFTNIIESNGSAASLTLNGGTLEGSGNVGNADSNLILTIGSGTIVNSNDGHVLSLNTFNTTIVNNGMLEALALSDKLNIQSPLTNDGAITAANGGNVSLFGNVASSTGTILIGNDGTLDVGGTVTGNVTFAGTGATLQIGGTINGDVVGAQAGDVIDFLGTTFAAGDKLVWQQNGATGSLMLETAGSTVLETLTLAGQYASTDFSAPSDDGHMGTETELSSVGATVQAAGGVDLRWALLYSELANSPITAGTATQYTAGFSGHVQLVVSGTGFTYSGTSSNFQLTGGTITGIQVEDASNNVLATFTGLSISATAFQAAINSYLAGGANPDPTALNAIFLGLIYVATGGAGADHLQGGNASNTFEGSTGNDTIAGGTGQNTMDYSGMTSPGLIAIIAGGNGTVNKGGANGTDTLSKVKSLLDIGPRSNGDIFFVDAGEIVTADSSNFNYLIELSAGVNLSYDVNFSGISEFVSNVGSNVVDFSNDSDFAYVYGSSGNDTLTLGSGGGYLFGEGGTNVLDGGENAVNFFEGGSGGTDTMNGGVGTAANYYYVDQNDQVNGAGAFNAVIELLAGVTVQIGGAQYQNVQEFVAGGGANVVSVASTDSDFIYLYGGAGNDTLSTGSGGGYLIGEGGTNVLNGGGGTNVFVADGASGVDTMNGGTGSNIYFIDANSIVHGAGTFNTVEELQQSATLTLGSAQLGSDIQEVVLAGGTNTADFHTASSAVFLYAGAGTNTLTGGTGNDFLYGSAGTTTFAFQQGWGKDTIMSWAGGSSNQIDLTALASLGVHATTDLTQTITNGSVVITSSHTGTNSITLNGVNATLTASSFHFA